MDPADTITLGQLLAIAALIGGACEYGEIIRRREERRRVDRERRTTEAVVHRRLERMTGSRSD